MWYRLLIAADFSSLHACFPEAFADYEVDAAATSSNHRNQISHADHDQVATAPCTDPIQQ